MTPGGRFSCQRRATTIGDRIEALAELGTRWARDLKSSVLAVPSAVIPQELNYLLNPLHSDFKRIRVGNPEAFRFDPRVK
jgi:RES domain-containing protein